MKLLLPRILPLWAVLSTRAALVPFTKIQQQPIAGIEAMSEPESTIRVPGNNNAVFGPVPKEEQLFAIEFLEIAPLPIPVSQIFFLYLQGEIPASKKEKIERHADNLTNATLSISLSAALPNGKAEERRTYTVPLRTTAFADSAHLAIRNAAGAHTEYLTSSGRNDILTDYWIPGMFLKTGMWTFEVVASLGDGTCLFALTLVQWLEGRGMF